MHGKLNIDIYSISASSLLFKFMVARLACREFSLAWYRISSPCVLLGIHDQYSLPRLVALSVAVAIGPDPMVGAH